MIIPLFNHAQYIESAIASVLSQGDIVGELIVIDDGSTDESAKVMEELERTDARICFWSQKNQGAHATINMGLSRASKPFLSILNSDDVYLPNRLNKLVRALSIDEGADIACSALSFINHEGKSISNSWYLDALSFYKATHDLGPALINKNFIMTTSNMLFRSQLVSEIGQFAPLRYTHDLDFALRATALRHRLTFVDEPLLAYRMHNTNTISENHLEVRVEWAMAAAHFLHQLCDGSTTCRSMDWGHIQHALDVVERHGLTHAVQLCLLYLRRQPARSLETSPMVTDIAFRAMLRACL